jgi:hypothetical protein
VRIICLFFSLYALTLALTPCADGLCGGDDQHISSDAHEDEKQDDLCSSFCICSCCGYSAADVSFSYDEQLNSSATTPSLNSLYKTPFITDFSIDFWQPPKLG